LLLQLRSLTPLRESHLHANVPEVIREPMLLDVVHRQAELALQSPGQPWTLRVCDCKTGDELTASAHLPKALIIAKRESISCEDVAHDICRKTIIT
jgi:hypothetical protein